MSEIRLDDTKGKSLPDIAEAITKNSADISKVVNVVWDLLTQIKEQFEEDWKTLNKTVISGDKNKCMNDIQKELAYFRQQLLIAMMFLGEQNNSKALFTALDKLNHSEKFVKTESYNAIYIHWFGKAQDDPTIDEKNTLFFFQFKVSFGDFIAEISEIIAAKK